MLKLLKKHVSVLLVLAILLSIVCVPGMLPVTSAAQNTHINLLTNPGFETRNAVTGWNSSPNPLALAAAMVLLRSFRTTSSSKEDSAR